jgi:DNA invertase Pin-like site-specific DNA recombinase
MSSKTKSKTKGTIGIVVRVSDVKGRDKKGDRFISPPEQIAKTTAYCRAAGYDVQVIEPMDLNVSHTTALDERPAMGQALRLVESGTLVGVGVASQDRIGPLVLTRALKKRLLEAGALLKVADNPSAEVLDARGYMKLPSEYMSLMHEAQREEIGLRWAAAQTNARGRGVLPQREPFGYTRDGSGRVRVAGEQAKQLRKAFERRAKGDAFSAIGRRFGWSHSTTRQRLINAVYMGVDGLVPAIVGRDLWEAANAAWTKQPVPPGATTKGLVLKGLVRCAGCRHTLKALRRARADGSFVQAYFCKNAASEPCPSRAYVHAAELEAFVCDWFERALAAEPRLVDAVAAGRELAEAHVEREAAEAELQAYVETASAIDRAVFGRGLDKRQARVDEARARVRDLSARVTALPFVGSILDVWRSSDAAGRREILRGYLDRIVVSRGASSDLVAHLEIVWADGTVADLEDDVRVAAA